MRDYQIIALALLLGFFVITFLQSAVDKVVDWKGNLEFLTGHFSRSPLAKLVPAMLGSLTVIEFISGLACCYGIIRLFYNPSLQPTHLALSICGVNLLMLLFGQRLAKDYAGAATVGIYMIIVLLGFVISV